MHNSVGLGLRHPFHDYVLTERPAVPWFEVITENYLFFDGPPRNFLRRVSENYPLVFHGVSLSIGSLEPIRHHYLAQLKKLIKEYRPLWISDHLCWTYNGAENSHDLLPVPFTRESLARIKSKVQQVQDFLGQKIYLENPSAYVDFAQNELTEQDFISELCQSSGCGLLLDLNNLVVNQHNLGYKPLHYLDRIKNCDVRQIHLAGHTIKENVRIDTHDADISQEVLDLLPYAKELWPNANPMLEWDDKIPPIEYLLKQRDKISDLWNSDKKNLPPVKILPSLQRPEIQADKVLHQNFWQMLKKTDYVTENDIMESQILSHQCPTPAQVGMNVYSSAYYARLLEVLEKDFPVLKSVLNELFPDVGMAYLAAHPSTYDSIDFIGNNLAGFIGETDFGFDLGVDRKIIKDVAAFENITGLCSVAFSDRSPALSVKQLSEEDWSSRKIRLNSTVMLYQASCEIHAVIDAVKAGQTPEIPELQTRYYVFYRHDDHTHWRSIGEEEFFFLNRFSQPRTFVESLNEDASNLPQFSQLLFANEHFFSVEY